MQKRGRVDERGKAEKRDGTGVKLQEYRCPRDAGAVGTWGWEVRRGSDRKGPLDLVEVKQIQYKPGIVRQGSSTILLFTLFFTNDST